MPIPEEQLETWSNQGATVTSQQTYTSIRTALERYNWPQDVRYEPYLQGSYANYTNVWDDSDVDVVVELTTTFRPDGSRLSDEERTRLSRLPPAAYRWANFRADVLQALRNHYGVGRVREATKCLEVVATGGRRNSHIVPSLELMNFVTFPDFANATYVKGISFWTTNTVEIWNYPKDHIANGAAKNTATNGRYKPTIRMFKNARTALVDSRQISGGAVSSYFLECLLYNVPKEQYTGSNQQVYANVVNYLVSADMRPFMCQNGRLLLFGTLPTQWTEDAARAFVSQLVGLWRNWR